MGNHSKKDVERLITRLQARHETLIEAMKGRDAERLTVSGLQPGVAIDAEDIRFAVEDVAAALKEIRARLGKG